MSSFLNSATNICHALNARKGIYPPKFDLSLLRASKTESVRDWFTRIVQIGLDGDIDRCLAEDHIAIFGRATVEKNAVKDATLQVLVTVNCTAENYIAGADCDPVYFRLDIHPGAPGHLFSEDLPHVHLRLHGAPRIGWGWPTAHNIFFDFIEFVYRSFAYEKWMEWASGEWNSYRSDRQQPLPPWDVLDDVYKNGLATPEMQMYKEPILTLKNTLVAAQKIVPTAIVSNEFGELCYLSRTG